MKTHRRQSGATLVIALLMLTVLAILGVNSVMNSTMDLRVVSNMQALQEAEAEAQEAIEQVISNVENFNDPERVEELVLGADVDPPECLDARPADGYSAVFALSPDRTLWEVRAAVQDDVSGAVARVRQGVVINMTTGSCP